MLYDKDDVYQGSFKDLHVRGMSKKKSKHTNRAWIIFAIHGFNLFYWKMGMDKVEFVSPTLNFQFDEINDNAICIGRKMETATKKMWEFVKINIYHNSFAEEQLYEVQDYVGEVSAFGFDSN
jgi:hypothetical protein